MMMPETHLDVLRLEIDKLDKEISNLLQKRMDIATDIAEYKSRFNKEIVDCNRETKVIENVLSQVDNPNYYSFIRDVYQTILSSCKVYQSNILENINTSEKKYGLIGQTLSHSLSSVIHNNFFKKISLNAKYEHIEVEPEDIGDILNLLRKRGFCGVNVTIPYKRSIMKSLDYVSSVANRIGAINTIDIGDKFKGYNTDYRGFGNALTYYGFEVENKSCAIIGTGGSGRAVEVYLEDNKAAKITIISRDIKAAAASFPGKKIISIEDFSAKGYDLVVNTTPVGMYPQIEASPITKEQLEGAGFVIDLIYNPSETLILKYARELGIPCANGLYMLVAQAISAEEIWHGITYEKSLVEKIFFEIQGMQNEKN